MVGDKEEKTLQHLIEANVEIDDKYQFYNFENSMDLIML